MEEFIQTGVTQFGSGCWKFDALDEVHKELPDFVGWQRGQGDKRESWKRPEIGAIFSTTSQMPR
jgi:hypothetical protein